MTTDMVSNVSLNGETAMKTLVSALIALSLLAGVVSSASALDAEKFWKDHPTSGER
jgi:hypothetical protein